MAKHKTLEEAYEQCKTKGCFLEQENIDIFKINTIKQLSETKIEVAEDIKKTLKQEDKKWSIIYTLYYDALRELAEIIIRFENKKIVNHQCLFAYLCKKYTDLDWNFFELVRTKRNGIEYYGSLATYHDWKKIEVQIEIYIKSLKRIIEGKLKNFNYSSS